MAPRLVKCYGYCGQKYPSDQMIKYKNANHCPECYGRKVKETEDREKLYNMLKEVFSINFPTGLMLRQIKQYREERNYSYRNIAFTIDYIINVKKQKLQMQYGIALVPHYYDEMIAYYKKLKEKREQTIVEEQQTIKVTIKPFNFANDYKERKLINMENLMNNLQEVSDNDN